MSTDTLLSFVVRVTVRVAASSGVDFADDWRTLLLEDTLVFFVTTSLLTSGVRREASTSSSMFVPSEGWFHLYCIRAAFSLSACNYAMWQMKLCTVAKIYTYFTKTIINEMLLLENSVQAHNPGLWTRDVKRNSNFQILNHMFESRFAILIFDIWLKLVLSRPPGRRKRCLPDTLDPR